ncbi:hypothetical protein EMIT07CA2_150062 [Brevibacillus sp. IT-7CA2]
MINLKTSQWYISSNKLYDSDLAYDKPGFFICTLLLPIKTGTNVLVSEANEVVWEIQRAIT